MPTATLAVASPGASPPRLHQQARLRAVMGLNLARARSWPARAAACARAVSCRASRPSTPACMKRSCSARPPIALARLSHDLGGSQTVRRERDDPDATNVLLRTIPVGYDRCKSLPIGSLHIHRLIVPQYEAVVSWADATSTCGHPTFYGEALPALRQPSVGEVQRWSDST